MGELLILIGFGLIALVLAFFIIYSLFKIASFFKRNYGRSIWPGVIITSLSFDLAIIGFFLMSSEEYKTYAYIFICISVLLFVIVILSTIKKFSKHVLQAITVQIVLAILQLIIFLLIIMSYMLKKILKTRIGVINRALNWTSMVFDI